MSFIPGDNLLRHLCFLLEMFVCEMRMGQVGRL